MQQLLGQLRLLDKFIKSINRNNKSVYYMHREEILLTYFTF